VSTANAYTSNESRDTLIAELETAVRSGSSEVRVKKLREVTSLFLVDAASLTEEQVKVFDDVLCKLTARIETKVLAELGQRLAPIDNAPVETIKRLAWNEAITVAGPVLSQSTRLTTSDLTQIAEVRGQAHLVAISKREALESPVTDVLLKRGEREVIHNLATNAGAKFSDAGYASLVEMTGGDEILSEAVGSRGDIPLRLLRDLLARATEAVRAKLLAMIPEEKREQLAQILSDIHKAVTGAKDGRYENAEKTIRALQAVGKLHDRTICDFARSGQLPEVIVGIALLASSRIEVVRDILNGDRNDAVLIPCKAVNLRWETVEQILRNRQPLKPVSEQIVELAKNDYRRLTAETAQKTLRFLQVKAVVK
jgi:uncharacterized protein (DUF2336 family)